MQFHFTSAKAFPTKEINYASHLAFFAVCRERDKKEEEEQGKIARARSRILRGWRFGVENNLIGNGSRDSRH